LLRRRILDLSKNRPEELAAMARECAVVMKGMTGAQLSASELKIYKKPLKWKKVWAPARPQVAGGGATLFL